MNGSVLRENFGHGIYRDLCCVLVGKVKFPGGGTAEGDAVKLMLCCQLQAEAVAIRQFPSISLCDLIGDNGPHCVEHMPVRQIIAAGQLSPTIGFRIALSAHQRSASLFRDWAMETLCPGSKAV